MALTCGPCLGGKHRCYSGNCACSICAVSAPVVPQNKKRVSPPREKAPQRQGSRRAPPRQRKQDRPGRPNGPTGVDASTVAKIEFDLMHAIGSKSEIASRNGVTYEQVRTVQRGLEEAGETVPEYHRPRSLDTRVTILEREVTALKEALCGASVPQVQEDVDQDDSGKTPEDLPKLQYGYACTRKDIPF